MKKHLMILFMITICLALVTGCGSKDTNTNSSDASDSTVDGTTETSNSSDEDTIELYSDNTKIVFKNGEGSLVFYYSGDTITKYEAYLNYGNAATAKYALASIEKDETIKKAYTKGKYLVIEYNESEYENLTVTEVRAVYSYLEEVKKNK